MRIKERLCDVQAAFLLDFTCLKLEGKWVIFFTIEGINSSKGDMKLVNARVENRGNLKIVGKK